ncbi:MAG: hypothetical protein ACI814_002380 [Mariniblastus sp.]|jgi:hypothetical protein
MPRLFFALLFMLTVSVSISHGQTGPPRLFDSGQIAEGRSISYFGQPAVDGKLTLDANNGFFDKGSFKAYGKRDAPTADKEFISAHFDYLKYADTKPGGSARWHVWINNPGEVQLEVHLNVPSGEAGTQWKVSLGSKHQIVQAQSGQPNQPQPWKLKFPIKTKGRYVIAIASAGDQRATATEFHQMKISGPAIVEAQLLRARWRPAAVHASFKSRTCAQTSFWVFETVNDSLASSYSPMTTSFGYFGASFNADGLASGGVNFSMWAAGRKAETAPPLASMPRLLATGNSKAEFGGFGHEGSGVKIRNWEPFSHHPRSVIQALRVESENGLDTFYGYLFDETKKQWILYAVGRKPSKRSSNELRAGSFCEIPGPPNVERTGDQIRSIRRRGWFLGTDEKWHAVDTINLGGKAAPSNRSIRDASEGWFAMRTGGVEMTTSVKQIVAQAPTSTLPAYLQPKLAERLFALPVTFGSHNARRQGKHSATIEYKLTDAGSNATAILFYGTQDCLTFAQRALHGTEKKGLSKQMLANDRTWQNQTEQQSVSKGSNRFILNDLKPNVEYFYRVLITNDQGKSWAFESGKF